MKIGGVQVSKPEPEVLVFPRGDRQIVFYAQAVDMEEFNKKYPPPEPPVRLIKNINTPDLSNPNYMRDMEAYNNRSLAYLVIRSLEPSNIEWDTVDINNPSSWENFKTDLKDNGFLTIEINRIIQLVTQANSLDENKLEQARKVFLQGQAQA